MYNQWVKIITLINYAGIKRIIDFVLSLLIMIVISPLILLISCAILIDSGLPIIFSQPRAGLRNKKFTIYKFRTMKKTYIHNIDFIPGNIPKDFIFKNNSNEDTDNYTRLGHFLRKWSLDELPQFYNVFIGNMSIVGPRPELIEIANCYNEEEQQRLLCKPGITGLAQINGRGCLKHKEKIDFDLQYCKNQSIKLDLKVMFLTIIKVFSKQGAF